MRNFLGPKENSLVPILHVRPIGWSGTENFGLLLNALLGVSRVLNSKCPKLVARTKKIKSGTSSVSRSGTLEGTLCLEIMSLKLSLQMKYRGACF
jgi:hypothetical protein